MRRGSFSTPWFVSTYVRISPFCLFGLSFVAFLKKYITATKTIELLPNGPTQRHFHVAAIDSQNQMWIHGGKSNGYHNDFYKYNIGKLARSERNLEKTSRATYTSLTWSGTMQWSHVVTKNPGPLARFGHSAVGSYEINQWTLPSSTKR